MDYIEENEELYKAWIGTKKQDKYYNKMKKGGFDWWVFIFEDLILLSRKMFVESLVHILIIYLGNTILGLIGASNIGYRVMSLGMGIILGYLYYPLYKWNIKRKIEKYKRKGLSYEEQLAIAQKYGGDKVTFGVIMMLLVEVVIVVMLSIIMNFIFIITGVQTPQNVNSNVGNSDASMYSKDSTQSSTKKKWILDTFCLSYDSNKWEEGTRAGSQVLNNKNKEGYLAYIRK